MHCHVHTHCCNHILVHCAICDVVYCSVCGKEWKQFQYHYTWYPQWTWTTGGNTYTTGTDRTEKCCNHK